MSGLDAEGFGDEGSGELAAFVARRAADLDLPIPDACLPGVLENLRALQDHARIVGAGLKTWSCAAETPKS